MSNADHQQRQKTCESTVKQLMSSSPRVRQLLESIRNSNPTISCKVCSDDGAEGCARAYLVNSTPLKIVLCTNRLKSDEFEEALTHELVHAFDYVKTRCDFETCEGLAYTEVRAAREAECANHFPPISWLQHQCIKGNAIRSTTSMFPVDEATKCVNSVFDAAMKDHEPLKK